MEIDARDPPRGVEALETASLEESFSSLHGFSRTGAWITLEELAGEISSEVSILDVEFIH